MRCGTRCRPSLRDADPIGLIAAGAPSDEHDPQVRTIVPRLGTCAGPADVQRVVHEEFQRWFTARFIGPAGQFEVVAQRIWEVETDRRAP